MFMQLIFLMSYSFFELEKVLKNNRRLPYKLLYYVAVIGVGEL